MPSATTVCSNTMQRLLGVRTGAVLLLNRRWPRSVLLTVIVLVTTTLAPLARAEPPALTADEFLARFERTDPRLEVLDARVQLARAGVTAARVLPNPSVAYDREEVFPSSGRLADNFVRLAWPVDVSGRRSLRTDAAESGVQATRAEAAAERFGLSLEALGIYYDAAFARLRLETLHQGQTSLARLVEIVRKRASAGDASGYDLKRLDLERASYDDLVATAETELMSARRRLGTLVGEANTRYDAADRLSLPALPGSRALIVASALAGRDDYKATRFRSSQADGELAAARRAWVPALALTGGLKSTDLGMGDTAYGYVAGVAVSIPLFDNGQAEKERAVAGKRLALAERRVLEQRVPDAARIAHEQLERKLVQARRFASGQLDKVDELVRAAEVSYREGERPSIFELLDAYRVARDVRLRDLELRRNAKASEIDLWRALGRRL